MLFSSWKQKREPTTNEALRDSVWRLVTDGELWQDMARGGGLLKQAHLELAESRYREAAGLLGRLADQTRSEFELRNVSGGELRAVRRMMEGK